MTVAYLAAIQHPDTVPTGLACAVGQSLPVATERIARALQPEQIVLFGSYACGQPTPDSDVDLLVIMNTNLQPLDRYLAVSQILDPRPFPVDIIVKTPAEVEQGLQRGDTFITAIMREGVVLYERTH